MEPITRLSKAFLEAYPDEAARILEKHPVDEVARLLEKHAADAAGGVLRASLPRVGADWLSRMDLETASGMVEKVDAEHAVRLLRHMGTERRDEIIDALPLRLSAPYRRQLQWPPDCAGAHMDPFVHVLPHDVTVAEAMKRARKLRTEAFHYPYVVDRDQKLVGILTVRELMLAGAGQRLGDIMRRDVIRVPVFATAEDIGRIPGWRAYQSLPVVEAQGVLVGVLRHDGLKRMEAGAVSKGPGAQWTDGLFVLSGLYARALAAMIPLMVSGAAAVLDRTGGTGSP